MRWTVVPPSLVSAAFLFGLGGCDDADPLYIARRGSDLQCDSGQICEAGECIAKDSISCTAFEGAQAILQPAPHALSFGLVSSGSSFQGLTLRNIGNCTLTLFEAFFETEGTRFGCSDCEPALFPIELFPLRDVAWTVSFTPADVGAFEDELILLSDDSEYPEIRVPVRARYDGAPEPRVAPEMVDFGYAPVGRTLGATVQIANHGSGVARLSITHIAI